MAQIDLTQVPYKELFSLQIEVKKEIHKRECGQIIGWECEVCGKQYAENEADKCVNHLKRVHRYPEEDASLSSNAIYK